MVMSCSLRRFRMEKRSWPRQSALRGSLSRGARVAASICLMTAVSWALSAEVASVAAEAPSFPAGGKSLPRSVRHVPFAPFQQLLPLCAAVVHHGGIGTTAQALASENQKLKDQMAAMQAQINAIAKEKRGPGRPRKEEAA